MVRLIKTIAAAFSMFSMVPMPQFPWTEEILRGLMCAFPMVGVLIGILCAAWDRISIFCMLPVSIRALGFVLIPVWVTGGIHLDGACDTWDALASRGDQKKMAQILKDPHIGSFAVIRLICLFLVTYVLWLELPRYRAIPVLLSFAVSRSLSGLAVVTFPVAEGSSLAKTFSAAADRKKAGIFLTILSLLLLTGMVLSGGWGMAVAAVLVFLWYRYVTVPRFGGLSGDLSGWFLQIAEVWMLAALYAAEFFGL